VSERLAAFDVGTNSTRLLVADVDGGGIVAEHTREMVITRLGKGVDRTGRFDPAALARTLEVLAGYAGTCRRLGVARRRLVATSATRDAADRQAFLDGVRDLLGVDAEVLTGRAEAATAYRGPPPPWRATCRPWSSTSAAGRPSSSWATAATPGP